MKRLRAPFFAVVLAGAAPLMMSADTNYSWVPFFMERAELEQSVFLTGEARVMKDPGKIWIDGTDIYVVERYRGVHIIDNSDSANPTPTDFIVAPGCMDIAVHDNFIYLDNAVDLVALNLATNTVTERLKNFFPEPVHPEGTVDRMNGYEEYEDEDKILVGWIKK